MSDSDELIYQLKLMQPYINAQLEAMHDLKIIAQAGEDVLTIAKKVIDSTIDLDEKRKFVVKQIITAFRQNPN